MLRATLLVLLMLLAPLSVVPLPVPGALEEALSPASTVAGLENYRLYLDSENNSAGGDGHITTLEPDGNQEEASVLGGLEFRSSELISDLTLYGEGSNNDEIQLTIYMRFLGQQGSTGDVTFSLKAGDSQIDSESVDLDDPCSATFGSTCNWVPQEVMFSISSNGYTVENGKQIKLVIDGQASCEGQGGGFPGSDSCDIQVAFGDLDSSTSTSRLEVMANALSASSVRVHEPGDSWNDPEVLEWAPNAMSDQREIQFDVDIRDAFGRADIESVSLVMSTPSGAGVMFDENFGDNDLRLDNEGLVGNFTWTYDGGAAMAPGVYPLALEIRDVQGHTVLYEHGGIEFVEHGVDLGVPNNQPTVVLIAPGQTSTVEFLLIHIGASAASMEVRLDLKRSLPSTWSDPVWDQPAGYTLSGGGSVARPILSIEVGEDLTNAPSRLEVEARAFAENEGGQVVEVAVVDLTLDFEEVGVYAEPRVSVFEDEEHQRQIADSNRPDLYDESLSHYVDMSEAQEGASFYLDLFNAGFDSDQFKVRVTELPESWLYRFYDNDTGQPLIEEGINAITPSIGSHQQLTLRMAVFPPDDREAQDIGLIRVLVMSDSDTELRTEVAFTVHRTFGVLAEIISDSDAGVLGTVGPISPGASARFTFRITDAGEESSETTWRLVLPNLLARNLDEDPMYGTWNYAITDESGANAPTVRLSSDEYATLRLDVELRDQVEAGNHTVYVGIVEDGVDSDEARYFDMPVTLQVKEDVVAGRLEVTQVSPLTPFRVDERKSLEFRVTNGNNVPLTVLISLDEPEGWDNGAVSVNSYQQAGSTLLLTVPAYSYEGFTVELTAPDTVKNNDKVEVRIIIEPYDEEVPFGSEYVQRTSFQFTTSCESIGCLVNELRNPEPATLGLLAILVGVVLYATYRRGATKTLERGGAVGWVEEESMPSDVEKEPAELDLPPPVRAPVDEDLELLDELDDL